LRTEVNVSERMRIDSSGNLLVGTTSSQSGASSGNGGQFIASPTGGSATSFARNSGVVNILNRIGSDGSVISIRKDGADVGSIGSYLGSYLYMGSTGGTDTHINFVNGNVRPATSTGAHLDNSLALGHSQSRWSDVYVGGGVYLGGTGTANKLDDYEEGTWTPTYSTGLTSVTYSAQQGQYTKVGRMVSFAFRLENTAGTADGNILEISGLPFTTNSSQPGSGAHWSYQPAGITGDETKTPILFVPLNQNKVRFYNAAGGSFLGSDLVSTTNDIYIRGVYFTN
jgi:hypothetical protein